MDEIVPAQHGGEKSTSPVDPWSISVKTVGGGIHIDENPSGERQFTVRVSPEDNVASLYDQIEASTGLKASQQRLIYRGRLIGLKDLSNNPKIKDIAGLSDGQTIHLVKRRETETPESATDGAASSDSTTSRDAVDGDLLGTGTGSRGLLAALLGLSSGLSDDNDEPTATRRWGLGAARPARPARRPHHRLTAEDRQVPDPGSLEPVRQGLLTLHTLLPHMPHASNPLEANREWYRGQWLDVLDTVNQWLEATVVEVMHPHQILPHVLDNVSERPRRRPPQINCDPPVSASDLEGRRHLLLEPCDDENDVHDLGGELAGFRPRSCNQGVQLLLIHYNGWPHRWDEWIRSDSDRLRPFRTRTRHPNVSSTASPTPQSVFHEAPRTNILPHGDDADDRWAVLPELARALEAVNQILQQQIVARPESHDLRSNLPWASSTPITLDNPDDLVPPSEGEETSNIIRPLDDAEFEHVDDGSADLAVNLDDVLGLASSELTPSPPTTRNRSQYNQRELFNLATLLDRLGRTLTDAAPHVASLAANLASEQPNSSEADELFDEAVEQALEEIADSMPSDSDGSTPDHSIGGLLSLWSRERRRRNNAISNPITTAPASEDASNAVITPDIEDYVNGLVNTTRGEVRTGPRSRLASDDVANLLGAYLAAATLGSAASSTGDGDGEEGGTSTGASLGIGQLLRGGGIGGGGGGGIDIHIHAVVTAPGMATGGLGITTLGGGGALAGTGIGGTRNLFSTTQRRNNSTTSILRTSRTPTGSLLSSRRRNNLTDEEDAGIFAELYSETPEPIDPNGSPLPGDRTSSPQSTSTHPNLPLANRTDHSTDYITGLRTSYGGNSTTFRRERETPADFLTRVNQPSSLDPTNVGAATQAGRGVSSTRRRSTHRSFRRETATDDASDTTLPRRTSWARLFRRRTSRDDPNL